MYCIDACLEGSLNKRYPFTTAKYGKIIYNEGRLGRVAKASSNGINLNNKMHDWEYWTLGITFFLTNGGGEDVPWANLGIPQFSTNTWTVPHPNIWQIDKLLSTHRLRDSSTPACFLAHWCLMTLREFKWTVLKDTSYYAHPTTMIRHLHLQIIHDVTFALARC